MRTPLASVGRALAAVLLALAAVVALMIATQVVVTHYLPQSSAIYLVSTLALALLYHFLGGQIGAAVAGDAPPAIAALVVAGAALMLSSVHHTWPTVAPWYSIAMLLVAPAGLWLGARHHARRRRHPHARKGAGRRLGSSPTL